jgi:hypothetical protein
MSRDRFLRLLDAAETSSSKHDGTYWQANGENDLITRPGTMIPYDKITTREISPAEMPAGTTAVQAAESIQLNEIINLFSQTATRIIIFDPNRHPVYIIRQKNVPADCQRMQRLLIILMSRQTGKML